MPNRSALALLAAGLIGTLATSSGAQAPRSTQQLISFASDIQPILEANCWACHGEALQLGKLDLRARDSALAGGEHGPALVPGSAERSRMYRRIAGLEEPAMPLEGTPLTPPQIAIIRNWIDQGAHWESSGARNAEPGTPNPEPGTRNLEPDKLAALERMDITPEQRNYWAFKLPVQSAIPPAASHERAHPIDRFLDHARRQRGLIAAPRADRRTLVRRAYLDLLGLPPTPDQVHEFLADESPKAWPRLIDKLLASPHYGERYGGHWLDVARYADSNGYEHDVDRPNAWRYRDYVIRSFNDDKPYDRFIKEQIAGDELDSKTDETLIATGFLRAGPRVKFREKDNPERRYDYLEEIIGTVGRGLLGMTVNCARCHNHKFDPIPQKDYYALQTSLFGYVEVDVPLAPREQAEAYTTANAEIDAKQQPLKEAIAALDEPYRSALQVEQLRKRFPEHITRAVLKPEPERTAGEKLLATQVLRAISVPVADIEKAMTPGEVARRRTLSDQIAALEKSRPAALPMAEIVTDGDWRFTPLGRGDDLVSCPKCRIQPGKGSFLHTGPGRYEPPPSHFLIRGDVNSPGSLMKPGFLTVATIGEPPTELPPADGRTSGRRRALAEWIASPQNPLTARVIVNRIWHHHFGRGIVSTLDNFGRMGDQPSHQELLDWMAVEFMNHGWSIKHLHRMIMTSDAYQMASALRGAGAPGLGAEHGGNALKDPENRYVWRFQPQRLEAEVLRDSMLVAGGNASLAIGGEPIFPPVPKVLRDSQPGGMWKEMPEGPATWRRSVYIYRRRSLPYPMFETFDHPDMNTTIGARNVSTVPTQALTLLNNPFVLQQAQKLADRLAAGAPGDPQKQIDLAYRIVVARPPTPAETRIALALVKTQSLVDFAHVVLNLNEFLYIR